MGNTQIGCAKTLNTTQKHNLLRLDKKDCPGNEKVIYSYLFDRPISSGVGGDDSEINRYWRISAESSYIKVSCTQFADCSASVQVSLHLFMPRALTRESRAGHGDLEMAVPVGARGRRWELPCETVQPPGIRISPLAQNAQIRNEKPSRYCEQFQRYYRGNPSRNKCTEIIGNCLTGALK
jgi:hypothetical protein